MFDFFELKISAPKKVRTDFSFTTVFCFWVDQTDSEKDGLKA